MDNSKEKILLVEDSQELLELWLMLFNEFGGYVVKGASTPTAAIELVAGGYSPDILITDYFLGELNGLELVEKLRKLVKGLKVYVITGNSDDENLKSKAAKMSVEVLYKPIKFRTLLSEIREVS